MESIFNKRYWIIVFCLSFYINLSAQSEFHIPDSILINIDYSINKIRKDHPQNFNNMEVRIGVVTPRNNFDELGQFNAYLNNLIVDYFFHYYKHDETFGIVSNEWLNEKIHLDSIIKNNISFSLTNLPNVKSLKYLLDKNNIDFLIFSEWIIPKIKTDTIELKLILVNAIDLKPIYSARFSEVIIGFPANYLKPVKKEMAISRTKDALRSEGLYYDWSMTLHYGIPQILGDVRSEPFPTNNHGIAWGTGISICKGLGYIASVCINGNYYLSYGQDYTAGAKDNNNVLNGNLAEDDTVLINYSDGVDYSDSIVIFNYKTNIFNGDLGFLFNLNKLIFQTINSKINIYGYAGIGILVYNSRMDAGIGGGTPYDGVTPTPYDYASIFSELVPIGSNEVEHRLYLLHNMQDGIYETQAETSNNSALVTHPSINLGASISYKVLSQIEIGIEHKFSYYFDDLADGQRWGAQGEFTNNNDLLQYTNLMLTFNLIKKDYEIWSVNPLTYIYSVVQEINPEDFLKDWDNDGVIDRLDKEPNTLPSAPVDTHGVSLDSDKDGCSDAEDPEPLSDPNLPIIDCMN